MPWERMFAENLALVGRSEEELQYMYGIGRLVWLNMVKDVCRVVTSEVLVSEREFQSRVKLRMSQEHR